MRSRHFYYAFLILDKLNNLVYYNICKEETAMTVYDIQEQAINKVNELGLTIDDLVELTGLSKSTIKKFMKGEMVFNSICKIWDTVKGM